MTQLFKVDAHVATPSGYIKPTIDRNRYKEVKWDKWSGELFIVERDDYTPPRYTEYSEISNVIPVESS